MTRWNRKKVEQLGMSYGKACHRLRKLVLFRLMQKVGEDVCSHCGKRIEDVDAMSIEHRKPWLDSDDPVGHFFDLANVAFSHLSCNAGAARNNVPVGKNGYRGVHYVDAPARRKKRWRVMLYHAGHQAYSGYFHTPEEAAAAYDKKAVEIFGLLAVTNSSLGLL